MLALIAYMLSGALPGLLNQANPLFRQLQPVAHAIGEDNDVPEEKTAAADQNQPIEAKTESVPILAKLAANLVEDKTKDVKSEKDVPKDGKDTAAKDEKKSAESAPKDEKKPAEEPLKPDVIPPPPEPSAEEIAKRKERAAEYQTLGEKFFDFPVTGSILNRYRMRTGGGDRDDDLSQFVTMDIGDPTRHLATAHIDARVNEDLNRHGTGTRSDLFTDLLDTYNSPVNARVYSAYVDFNKVPGLERMRVGRQWEYDTPEILQFDGLRFDTKPLECAKNLQFSLYGGVPIHHFEPSAEGDWLAGFAAEAQPWKGGKLRFDYIHIDDDLSDFNAKSTDPLIQSLFLNTGLRRDDLCSLSFWQKFKSPDVRVNGHFSIIDGEARDAQIRTTYANNAQRLQVSGSYSIWWAPQTELVTEFDPYFETLRGLKPYNTGNLVVSKGWCEWLWMDVNATSRRLIENNSEAQFNREFNRYMFTLQTRDALKKGLKLSVTASRWEGMGHAPDTTQVGGEVSYEWKKHLETSAGSDYALYKYDFFNQVEHDQVRSYYFRQRWKPARWAKMDAKYEFEQAQKINYHTFTLQFRFDF